MSEAKKVLVINETERLLHYCETSTSKATLEGRDVDIPFHKATALIPGCNVVDDDKWLEAFQKSHVYKFHASKGLLRIVPFQASKDGKQKLDGLLGFEELSALEYVGKTFRLGVLEDWQRVETRAEVKDALKKQITYVKSELEAPEQEDRILFKTPPVADAAHMRV